jgi:hypothetical protein
VQKWLVLLKEIAPTVTRVAVICDPRSRLTGWQKAHWAAAARSIDD